MKIICKIREALNKAGEPEAAIFTWKVFVCRDWFWRLLVMAEKLKSVDMATKCFHLVTSSYNER